MTEAPVGEFTVKGPFAHGNLAVFMILGESTVPEVDIVTLKLGLETGAVTVHETGNVQQLAIENASEKSAVFVQAGDIVKGGKQDRVITVDILLPPKSGRVSISSFCVERGRWSRRGKESAAVFDSNPGKIPDKGLKYAAKKSKNQGDVWGGSGRAAGETPREERRRHTGPQRDRRQRGLRLGSLAHEPPSRHGKNEGLEIH